MNQINARLNKIELILNSLQPNVPDYSSIINKPSMNELKINDNLDIRTNNIININTLSANTIDTGVVFKEKVIFEKGYSIYGESNEVDLVKLIISDNKLILSKNNNTNQIDFGIVGIYNKTKFSGLIRDADDNGKWKLFSNIEQNLINNNIINFSDTNLQKDTLSANIDANTINCSNDMQVRGKLLLGPSSTINQQLKIKGSSSSEIILTGILQNAESKIIIEQNESNGVELNYKNNSFLLKQTNHGVITNHIIINDEGLHLPTLVKPYGPKMLSGYKEFNSNSWYVIAIIEQKYISTQFISFKGNYNDKSFVIDIEFIRNNTKANLKKYNCLMEEQLFNKMGCFILDNICYVLVNYCLNTPNKINYELWCDNKFNKTNTIIISPEIYNYNNERFSNIVQLR